jgi:hypothetical protein
MIYLYLLKACSSISLKRYHAAANRWDACNYDYTIHLQKCSTERFGRAQSLTLNRCLLDKMRVLQPYVQCCLQ